MAKEEFSIRLVSKIECTSLLANYHYLSTLSRGFKSGYNYGLIKDNQVVGVCIFTGFPVPELAVGMLGLLRTDQDGLYELSRLCVAPEIQSSEYNITSWFVARAIKQLRKSVMVRCILSYADSDYHSGVIYKALNFKYYGLSKAKKDFYIRDADGSMKKHSRGKIKGVEGEWRNRSQKHRFVLLYDRSLTIQWSEEPYLQEEK